jgi:hypothetical protein
MQRVSATQIKEPNTVVNTFHNFPETTILFKVDTVTLSLQYDTVNLS